MIYANYITRAGYFALKHELKNLLKIERPAVTQAVSDAALLGDRSENAEYIFGKKRLREIDRRIRFLTKRLQVLKIVDFNPHQVGKIYFGAYVTLIDENDKEVIYRIVGVDEFNPKKSWISVASPVARALIGHKVDDEVTIKTPSGDKHFTILNINYDKDDL